MDIYNYIAQLAQLVNQQQKEIIQLQTTIANLSSEIKLLKEKPSVTVEKLEYKFDQLKVETLEGTLNIGLNPSDLNNIEDFAIDSQTAAKQPKQTEINYIDKLLDRVNYYIDQELDTFIEDTEKETGMKLDSQYHHLIKEDIRKQLPARTEHYVQYFNNQRNDGENIPEKLYQTILADINQAVRAFIMQTPTN